MLIIKLACGLTQRTRFTRLCHSEAQNKHRARVNKPCVSLLYDLFHTERAHTHRGTGTRTCALADWLAEELTGFSSPPPARDTKFNVFYTHFAPENLDRLERSFSRHDSKIKDRNVRVNERFKWDKKWKVTESQWETHRVQHSTGRRGRNGVSHSEMHGLCVLLLRGDLRLGASLTPSGDEQNNNVSMFCWRTR